MKTHRFFSVFLLLILAVSLLTGPASAAEVPDPAIQAKAALLVDANTGRMVYGKNEHEELYPASLTKIMTALLTLEAVDSGQLSMDQPITVTESALEGLAADGSTARTGRKCRRLSVHSWKNPPQIWFRDAFFHHIIQKKNCKYLHFKNLVILS